MIQDVRLGPPERVKYFGSVFFFRGRRKDFFPLLIRVFFLLPTSSYLFRRAILPPTIGEAL